MTDNHAVSFFGQKTGIIVTSPSKSDANIFMKCIKKKENEVYRQEMVDVI